MNNSHATIDGKSTGQCRIPPFSIVVLVLSLLTLSSCGFQKSNGNQSSMLITADAQPATNTPAGALTTLHMINATIGWAQSQILYDSNGSISYTILRTTDGGKHWKVLLKCAPFQGFGKGAGFTPCLSDFHSASAATVLQPEDNNQSRIFHTSDGGQTWQEIAHSVV